MSGWSNKVADTTNSSFYVRPLHEVPDLITECCQLLNKEWKRSLTARLRSIEGSSENFPMSLLLLKFGIKKPEVVGHCKISRLSLSTTKVFVESVVIHPSMRGKGLGTFLMYKVEELCKRKNIKWIYLSTKGQENFYEKLGYTRCPPVSIYGCQFNNSTEDLNEFEKVTQTVQVSIKNSALKSIPPPPPPPPTLCLKVIPNYVPSTKTFMKKSL